MHVISSMLRCMVNMTTHTLVNVVFFFEGKLLIGLETLFETAIGFLNFMKVSILNYLLLGWTAQIVDNPNRTMRFWNFFISELNRPVLRSLFIILRLKIDKALNNGTKLEESGARDFCLYGSRTSRNPKD